MMKLIDYYNLRLLNASTSTRVSLTNTGIIVESNPYPVVKKVIFNPPATIIIWDNGQKTIAKCSPDDTWDAEKGFAYALLKGFMPKEVVSKLRKKFVKPQLEKEEAECLANLPMTIAEIGERLKQWAEGYNIGEHDDRNWEEVAKTEDEE